MENTNDDYNYETEFIDMSLDETTGLFVDNLDKSSSSQELEAYANSSENLNTSIESNGDNDLLHRKKTVLNECTGLSSRQRARKNQATVQDWERNKVKKARETGQSYYSVSKTKDSDNKLLLRNARKIKPGCNSKKCVKSVNKKCNEITEGMRKQIFNSIWNDLTWAQRRQYVVSLVDKDKINRSDDNFESRRSCSLKYHLLIKNQRLQVCKKMFLNTIGVGEWQVLNWVKKRNDNGILKTPKIKNTRKNSKIDNLKKAHVRKFLTNLPKLESHYCRKQSAKLYLENLYQSAQGVYRDYVKYMNDLKILKNEIASYECLRKEMKLMNISIYTPRKDFCDTCFSFKNKNISEEVYSLHLLEKNRAREEKLSDKLNAKSGKIKSFTVDVQAVQMIPFLPAGSLYFKQKLKCHQFTVYNIGNGDTVCYVWHEGEGGMDGNVFASCLIDFLKNEIDLSTPIVFYSDGCSAQNRNVTLANALYQFANQENITIYQKYLVKGHTQMECDSVHSTIEKQKKNRELYVPANFVQIIQEARLKKPYKVKYVDHTFFYNYSEVKICKSIRPGNKRGSPTVLQLRGLKYSKEGIMYKLSFNDEWKDLPQQLNKKCNEVRASPLYQGPIPITAQKFKDLQSLKSLIHKDYHPFYENLLHVDE